MNAGDVVNLVIILDACEPKELRRKCREIANAFVWSHGSKHVIVRKQRVDDRMAMLEAFYPNAPDSVGIVLQEGMEVRFVIHHTLLSMLVSFNVMNFGLPLVVQGL